MRANTFLRALLTGVLAVFTTPLSSTAQSRIWNVHVDTSRGTNSTVTSSLSDDLLAIEDVRLVDSERDADWVVFVDTWGSGSDLVYFLSLREAVRFGDALFAATIGAGRTNFYRDVTEIALADPDWPGIRDAVVGYEVRDVRLGVAPPAAVNLSGFVTFFDQQCLERSRLNLAQFKAYQDDDSGALDAIGDRLARLRC